MVVCRTYMELGDYAFDYVADVKITSSWKNLTDTATISLPKMVVHRPTGQSPKKAVDLIKRGDKALVKFGYNDTLSQRFSGYVVGVKPGMPMEFTLEDEMFQYKSMPVTPVVFKDGSSVEDVLKHLGFKPNQYDLLGDIRIIGAMVFREDVTNVAMGLKKLKDTISLPIFYRNGKINVGDPYKAKSPKIHYLALGHNVVEHKLEWKDRDEVKIKVQAVSMKRDGSQLKVEVGDTSGEVHTLHFPDMAEADLRAIAEAHVEKLKWTGWRGSLTTFAEPSIEHGDIVNLSDYDSEIEGKYFIDEVVSTSGTGGIRQELKLGAKA